MLRFLPFILFFSFSVTAQNQINADNYYSHYKDYEDYKKFKVKSLSTGRLNEFDVAKILHEEMKLAGFEWLSTFRIVHIEDDKYITSICYSEKSKFGFVFEDVFNAIPDKKIRDLERHSKSENGYEYTEKIVSTHGESKFVKIEQLPESLYLIRSDIYWYQNTENEEIKKTLVTKEIIKQILRDDIKNILKSVKKE